MSNCYFHLSYLFSLNEHCYSWTMGPLVESRQPTNWTWWKKIKEKWRESLKARPTVKSVASNWPSTSPQRRWATLSDAERLLSLYNLETQFQNQHRIVFLNIFHSVYCQFQDFKCKSSQYFTTQIRSERPSGKMWSFNKTNYHSNSKWANKSIGGFKYEIGQWQPCRANVFISEKETSDGFFWTVKGDNQMHCGQYLFPAVIYLYLPGLHCSRAVLVLVNLLVTARSQKNIHPFSFFFLHFTTTHTQKKNKIK